MPVVAAAFPRLLLTIVTGSGRNLREREAARRHWWYQRGTRVRRPVNRAVADLYPLNAVASPAESQAVMSLESRA